MKGSKMVVNENEQLEKFYQDELTQYYFEALGRLIAKKSIFAQQIGLAEVAGELGQLFTEAGAEVTIDDICTAPLVLARFKSSHPEAKTIIFTIIMIRCLLMMTNRGHPIHLN